MNGALVFWMLQKKHLVCDNGFVWLWFVNLFKLWYDGHLVAGVLGEKGKLTGNGIDRVEGRGALVCLGEVAKVELQDFQTRFVVSITALPERESVVQLIVLRGLVNCRRWKRMRGRNLGGPQDLSMVSLVPPVAEKCLAEAEW